MAKNPVSQPNSEEISRFLEGTANFSDIIFGFTEESSESTGGNLCDYEEDDNEDVEERKAFWEAQEKLLQVNFIWLIVSKKKLLEMKLGELNWQICYKFAGHNI